MTCIAATLVLILLQPAPETDVIQLKDGGKRTGFIVSETADAVVIEVLLKGPKGETIGLAKSTVLRADIVSIQRIPDDQRDKARARALAFKDRGKMFADAMAAIKTEPDTILDVPALRTTGQYVVIRSTCDAEFLKEVHYALEQVFAAYGKHFKIKRNEGLRVDVFLLASRAEYMSWQKAKFGGAIANPAFYHTKENFIAAYNGIQKEEAAKVKKVILERQAEVKEFRKLISDEEARIKKEVDAARTDILDQATKLKNQIRKEGGANMGERLKQVDKAKDEALEGLKQDEKAIKAKLDEYRKRCSAEIERCEKIVATNVRILRDQNKSMFETLFHEGFHAFATNYLFADKEIPRWLNEGMASYFEMSVVEAGELIHGAAHPGFLKILRDQPKDKPGFYPLEKILKAGPEMFLVTHLAQVERSNMAYAQSWAIAHYLAKNATSDQIDKYVTAVTGGADAVQVFADILGKPARETDDAVRKHIDGLK